MFKDKNIKQLSRLGVLITALILLGLLWRGLRGETYVANQLDIGIVTIRFYSLTALAAILTGLYLYDRLRKGDKVLQKIDIWEGLLFAIIPGIIGARIYHVITDFYLYQDNLAAVIAVWDGGVGFIGGVVGGGIGLWLFSKYRNIDFQRMITPLVVVLPVSHAIGRLGNFFNQELYGFPTSLPWSQFIRPENRFAWFSSYEYYHPLFLYEALSNLVLAFLLYTFWKRGVSGLKLIYIYAMGYGVIRFTLDFLRIDGNTGVYYLSYAQWLVLGLYVVTIVFGLIFQIWFKYKYGIWFTKHSQLKEKGLKS